MSTLQESLRRFLAVEGVRTAALIDIATGMIVRSVGKPDPVLGATAACGQSAPSIPQPPFDPRTLALAVLFQRRTIHRLT